MSFLKARWPWLAGFAAFAAALVLLAAAFRWHILLVVLLLVIVAIAVVIVLLIQQLRKTQAAEEIERTITTQADADIERSTAGQIAETQQLKEALLEAIAQLKSSGKRAGADALATLPWYLLIGPAGAGKSELVKRSGLDFPLREATGDPRAVRGVGGTRGFSWWLSQDAVLLDLTGKMLATAAFDDSGDWIAFLDTLRKQRGQHPVNGALVVVAVDQIADQPEARIDSVARAARERLQEVVEHLGVVFPVYVVFNRLDRVAGFAEYFDDLSTAERREPWGATLSRERARSHAAEQLFEEEYGVLLASLSERRIPRMAAMGEASSRARAFAFPLQLERVRGSLRRFVRTLFDSESGDETPLFRGFYLTASAQAGETEDRVLQPAVRSLGLNLRSPEVSPPVHGGAWFVRDLFTEVVFPDAGLVETSKGAAGALKHGERLVLGIYAAAFVVLLALFSGFSCANHATVARARKAAIEVANNVTDETALIDNLRTLDRLRDAADALDQIERRVPFARRLGGWAGGVERGPAVRLWMLRMAQLVLKPAAQQMEDDLRARAAGAPGNFLDDFYRFRAWRLLTEPNKIDPEDARILTREVTRALADRLELGGSDVAGRAQYPELVRRQMEFLARNPRDLAAVVRPYIPEQDRTLVPPVAAIVRDEWQPEAFYRELLAEAGARDKGLGFETLAGQTSLMSGGVTVPGPFTAAGWDAEVKPLAAWYGRMARRDALLAVMFGGRTPELERDVLGYYAPDVTRHWVEFLDGVSCTKQTSVGGAADLLARLGKGDSPMFKLLRGVNEETKGIAGPGLPVEAVARDFQPLAEFFAPPGSLGQRTKDFLADLPRLIPGRGNQPSTARQSLDAQYMDVMARAQADVKGLGGGASLQDFQSLLSPPPDKTNGLYDLVSFADGLGTTYDDTPVGPAVARLLREPASVVGEIVRTRGLGPRVAAAWQSIFLQRFQSTLGNAYPFAGGGPDASPDEFAACFGPTGYFWTFYAQHLAPFLNEDGSPKSPEAPPVSGEMVAFLRKAYAIRTAFFPAGPAPSLAFTVSTTPPEHDRGALLVRWIALDCGGQTVTYTMGPPRDEPLRWPGEDMLAAAGLRAQAAPPENAKKKKKKGEPESLAVESVTGSGFWGLFRLLDRAGSVTSAGGVTRATWTMRAAGGTTFQTTWEFKITSGESPFARGFLRLNAPATP